ncbi:unnamed protein product [Protopolystoma xenopodis]|uniref:guanylate cyclase n=1 Tax=Protopolystoma xenopodis TaxID=117903 RepID=A0A448WHU3_9PLAT|nr:unnamed protein product [Protopolystoma xenopodis]
MLTLMPKKRLNECEFNDLMLNQDMKPTPDDAKPNAFFEVYLKTRLSHECKIQPVQIQKSKQMEESMRRLDKMRRMTDELLYQCIPKNVAKKLRRGTPAFETIKTESLMTNYLLVDHWKVVRIFAHCALSFIGGRFKSSQLALVPYPMANNLYIYSGLAK